MNKKKLNTGKGRTAKKGGFFRKWANRPSNQELQNLTSYYDKLTAAIPNDFVMEKLDSPEAWHYLRLLKIAEYRKMGKSFAILTAWKLGYMAGKAGADHEN